MIVFFIGDDIITALELVHPIVISFPEELIRSVLQCDINGGEVLHACSFIDLENNLESRGKWLALSINPEFIDILLRLISIANPMHTGYILRMIWDFLLDLQADLTMRLSIIILVSDLDMVLLSSIKREPAGFVFKAPTPFIVLSIVHAILLWNIISKRFGHISERGRLYIWILIIYMDNADIVLIHNEPIIQRLLVRRLEEDISNLHV